MSPYVQPLVTHVTEGSVVMRAGIGRRWWEGLEVENRTVQLGWRLTHRGALKSSVCVCLRECVYAL